MSGWTRTCRDRPPGPFRYSPSRYRTATVIETSCCTMSAGNGGATPRLVRVALARLNPARRRASPCGTRRGRSRRGRARGHLCRKRGGARSHRWGRGHPFERDGTQCRLSPGRDDGLLGADRDWLGRAGLGRARLGLRRGWRGLERRLLRLQRRLERQRHSRRRILAAVTRDAHPEPSPCRCLPWRKPRRGRRACGWIRRSALWPRTVWCCQMSRSSPGGWMRPA